MLKPQTLISGKSGVVVIVSDMLSGPGQKILLLQAFFLLMRTAVRAILLEWLSRAPSAISSEKATSTCTERGIPNNLYRQDCMQHRMCIPALAAQPLKLDNSSWI